MATSGSSNFNLTRNQIVQEAFALIGEYGLGRTISAEDEARALNALNMMVKAWSAKGTYIWSTEEGVLLFADNVGQYTLSNDSTSARACLKSDFVISELTSAHSASDTTIEVDSTTGMTAADIVGVVLDSDVIHWTTIVSVDSSTQITLTSGLATVAANNNNVYTFTSRITKPLKITSARLISGIDSTTSTTKTERILAPLTRQEYYELANSTSNGTPTSYYYSPDLTTGQLNLWPRPDDPETYLEFTYMRHLEDFDSAADNADFPVEWLETITYQLALRLAVIFGKETKVTLLSTVANTMFEEMKEISNQGMKTLRLTPYRR